MLQKYVNSLSFIHSFILGINKASNVTYIWMCSESYKLQVTKENNIYIYIFKIELCKETQLKYNSIYKK